MSERESEREVERSRSAGEWPGRHDAGRRLRDHPRRRAHERSAPSLTLAKALAGLGVGVRFVRADRLTRREWVEMVRAARAILLLTYGQIDVYVLSQLATAVAMDVPIVRWWVGTDVLNAITQPEVRAHAQRAEPHRVRQPCRRSASGG